MVLTLALQYLAITKKTKTEILNITFQNIIATVHLKPVAPAHDTKSAQYTVILIKYITSCLMVPYWLKKVKGGSGSILHG